ncbi:MAG: MBL fold metallo-hydrolase [Elusimicrobiota bacterium]
MKIKIVAEASTTMQRLFVGWGVSFLVGDDLLFDTFSSEKILASNFKKLTEDVKKLKYVVLSHEHWDHIGGLRYVLKNNPDVKVFICPNFSQNLKEKIKKYDVEVIEMKNFAEIKRGIFTTGEIMGEYNAKPMPEQSLIIRNNKISIITGCSHPGIIAIIKKVKQVFSEPVGLVLGGFHLHDKLEFEVQQIAREFRDLGVEKIAPCHCTGALAKEVFRKEYGGNFVEIKTGVIL